MIIVKRLNKKYGKRKLRVYEDNKLLGEIGEHFIGYIFQIEKIMKLLERLQWKIFGGYSIQIILRVI